MSGLHVRAESDWTVIDGMDMHGEEFRVSHWHPNAHVSISIPINRKGFHTRQLSRRQCGDIGTMFLRMSRAGQLTETELKDDFQI